MYSLNDKFLIRDFNCSIVKYFHDPVWIVKIRSELTAITLVYDANVQETAIAYSVLKVNSTFIVLFPLTSTRFFVFFARHLKAITQSVTRLATWSLAVGLASKAV